MGSGPRFWCDQSNTFGLGFFIRRFPHTVSINILILMFNIYIGIGKGYDEN